MSSRSYVNQHGELVAVEVEARASIADVAHELTCIHGRNCYLGRWGGRGRCWRAEVLRKEYRGASAPTEEVSTTGLIRLGDATRYRSFRTLGLEYRRSSRFQMDTPSMD